MKARVFVTLKPSVFDPQGRTIVEAHDGRLWFERNDGPGLTFHVCLPLRRR